VNTFNCVGDAMLRPLLDELDRGNYDVSSLLAIANGGAPLTAALKARTAERLPSVIISDSVGSSETGAQMVSNAATGSQQGQFRPGPGAVVVSEALDRLLAPGEEALGWLAQSGWVPLGYLGDQAKTAKTFPVIDGQRYAVPGDRARLLSSGEIELLGRDSVTINSGGEKIFAEEVEGAIAGHPAVFDVVVTGRPSERWGSEVVAVVAFNPGVSATKDELCEWASNHIARYKLPKDVVVVDRIVRSPAGKADYRWAKEQVTNA
jgi:acyl-CoA synthetase (AMP-forming)/AMP-acid ligase II